MNTVTLRQDAYASAQRYARKQNKSVDEVVNNLVITYFVNASSMHGDDNEAFQLKSEQELSPIVRDLIGIASETSLDAKEARAKYLEEKFGA